MRMRRKRWPASSSLSVQDHLPTRDTVSTTGWRGRMSRRHPIQRLTITTSSPPQPLGFHHHTTDPFLLTHTLPHTTAAPGEETTTPPLPVFSERTLINWATLLSKSGTFWPNTPPLKMLPMPTYFLSPWQHQNMT